MKLFFVGATHAGQLCVPELIRVTPKTPLQVEIQMRLHTRREFTRF
jgi:hypothetical protein